MNLGRNVLWNLGAFVWLTGVILVVTPFMARRMGLDAFGVWAVLTAIIGYLTTLDFGIGNAIIRHLAFETSRGRTPQAHDVLRTGVTLQLAIGVLVALLFHALVPAVALRWLRIPPGLEADTLDSFRISAFTVFFGLVTPAFAAAPAALRRFDILAVRTVLLVSLQYLAVVGVLARGGGLPEVALAYAAGSLLILGFFAVSASRLLPGIRLIPGWDRAAAGQLLRFGRGKFPAQVGVNLMQQLDRVAVAAFLPVALAGYYAVPLRIAQRLGTIVEQVAAPFYPAITAHLASGSRDVLRHEFRIGARIVAIAVCGTVAVLGGLARPLLAVWMGGDFADHGTTPFRILLAGYAAGVMFTLPSVAADAAGRPGINGRYLMLGATLHVVLLWLWVPRFGLTGAAAAVLCGFLVPLIMGIPAIHRAVPVLPSVRMIVSDCLSPVLAGAVVGTGSAALALQPFPSSGVLPLLATFAAASLAYVLILVLTGGFRAADLRRIARSLTPDSSGAGRA